MPNIITNIVKIDGFDKRVQKTLKGESDFDFEKLIPMPPEIKNSPEEQTTGLPKWYEWSVENWGTKWPAWDVNTDGEGTYIFSTAWAHPLPIIKKLSKMFPSKTIGVSYADEDIGHNLGIYTIKGGKIIDQADIKEDTAKARALAKAIKIAGEVTEQ